MRHWITALSIVLAAGLLAGAQISIPNTFTPNTRIVSADVNENFTELGDNALNRGGGTMTGPLVTQAVTPDGNNTRDLGVTGTRWRDGWFGRNLTVTGTGTFTGVISGPGSGITAIAETNITDGAVLARVAANETLTGNWTVSSATPVWTFNESDGGSNEKNWRITAASNGFVMQALDDALSSSANFFAVSRTGTTVTAIGLAATAVNVTGRLNSASVQPGFLAYNSVADTISALGGTVDFDTEVYDTTNSFSADVFTAPVTGIYQLCTTVFTGASGAGDSGPVLITTSNRAYRIGTFLSGDANSTMSGCVFADMDAADTATVGVQLSAAAVNIDGGGSPYRTFFSGRLMP